MSASTSAATPGKEPAKSKKLIVIGAVVALLVIVAAGLGLFLVNKQRSGADEEGQETAKAATTLVPTFLPLENMVVNLADAGGDRFAQIGITLELQDEQTAGAVKQYMPSIRNGVLMLVSQRTAEELLRREGKEKLAADILVEVSRPLGFGTKAARVQEASEDDEEAPRPRRRNPVRRVLFSSFIIQ